MPETSSAAGIVWNLADLYSGPDDAQIIADPSLANYRHHLSSALRYKPHTRSEPEELLLNQKSLTARAAWTTLFDEFVASLEYTLEYDGQKRTLTQPAILTLNYDAD